MLRRALPWALAAPWVAWALARTLSADAIGHPVVAAMAYTPYAAALSPVPILAALLLGSRAAAVVAALAAAALAVAVAPRALDGPQPERRPDGPALTVMTANVLHGQADMAAVMRLVREHRVDVLSVQELTPEGLARLDAAGAAQALPGRTTEPAPGARGSGLLARRALRPVRRQAPAGAAQPEALVAVRGAPPVRMKTVHPPPPISRAAARTWRAALRAIPGSDGRGDVRIVAGDFNATLDHRELRRLLDRGYTDAADATGSGLVTTWPVLGRRRALPIAIDHVLVDRRVRVDEVVVERVPGTDHKAVIARLTLPRPQAR